ncbi:MAG: DUF998 domain-containing protein [Actinomycetia bacterium]|nr:DUF998 domain-containing protein [Actinomycetes bacterium]
MLLATAGAVTLMGITTAEAIYPRLYTTTANEISDLGGHTVDGVILQPSGYVFTAAMVTSGLATIAAAVLLLRAGSGRLLASVVLLNGVGTLGVGLFPSGGGAVHPSFAVVSFVAGALCGLAGGWARRGPVSWFSYALGAITSVVLLLALFGGLDGGLLTELGIGGAERWIAYPIVLWQVMFGGALMASSARRIQPSG